MIATSTQVAYIHSLSTALCESNSLSGQVGTKCPTRPDTQGRHVEAALMHPWPDPDTCLRLTAFHSVACRSTAHTSQLPYRVKT